RSKCCCESTRRSRSTTTCMAASCRSCSGTCSSPARLPVPPRSGATLRLRAALVALAAASALSGCMLFRASDDLKEFAGTATIIGTLEAEEVTDHAVVVGVFRDEDGKKSLANYYVRWGPGPFRFILPAGRYHVFAFEDRNENLRYDE